MCIQRAVLVVGLLVVVACGGDDKSDTTTLKLAASLDRTGPTGSEQYGDALTMVKENFNKALPKSTAFADIRIDYDWQDNQGTGTVAAPQASTFVQNGAHGIVADLTDVVLQILDLQYDGDASNDLDVPIVSVLGSSGLFNNPAATDPDPTNQAAYRDSDKWHYDVCLATNSQAPAVVDLLRRQATSASNGDINGDGVWKVSISATDDAVGTSLANGMKTAINNAATANGQTAIVEIISFPASSNPKSFDWSGQLDLLVDDRTESAGSSVQDNFTDEIFPASLSQFSSQLVNAYATRQLTTPPIVHWSGFFNDSIFSVLANGQGEGMIGTTHASWDLTDEGTAMQTQYESEFPHPGTTTTFVPSKTYDAAVLLALGHFVAAHVNGVSINDVTGAQVRDAIGTLNDPNGTIFGPTSDGLLTALNAIAADQPINYQGASASLDFDANRRVRTKVEVFQVHNLGFDIESGFYYDCEQATCPRVTQ